MGACTRAAVCNEIVTIVSCFAGVSKVVYSTTCTLGSVMPKWLSELLPISALLVVIALVVSRLPKIELGHSKQFLNRRLQNWLPVGLTYAFLYMARYNLNAAIGPVFSKAQFADVYFWGT